MGRWTAAPCEARWFGASGCTGQVVEEIGHDLTAEIDVRDFIEVMRAGQKTKLFIVAGVDEQTCFAPQTRKACGPAAPLIEVEGGEYKRTSERQAEQNPSAANHPLSVSCDQSEWRDYPAPLTGLR